MDNRTDIKNICRVCLTLQENKVEIFEYTVQIIDEEYNLWDMFRCATSLNIKKNDGLPQIICQSCVEHLCSAYIFKTQCERSNSYLNQALKQNKNVKLTTVDDSKETQSNIEKDIINLGKMISTAEIADAHHIDGYEIKEHENIFVCIACNEIFYNDNSLKTHLEKFHTDSTSVCTICSTSFNSFLDFYEHSSKTHTDIFQCVQWNETFSNKQLFNRHRKIHDSSTLCSICGKAMSSPHSLKMHLLRHRGEKHIQCTQCDKKFFDKQKLNIHMRVHTGEKPYICQFDVTNFCHFLICGKGFAQLNVLTTHLTLHTGKPVTCSICGQRYSRKSQLTVHMRTHTGERPFTCNVCGKSFMMNGHLKEHMTLHSNHRPHKCDKCGYSFKHLYTLRAHEKTHLKIRPYKCEICGLSFIRRNMFLKHQVLHI